MVRARRWDLPTVTQNAEEAPPATTPAVDLRYTYDAGDQRVLKTAVDAWDNRRYTVYALDSLELKRTSWTQNAGSSVYDYQVSEYTEVPYLYAHGVRLARVVVDPGIPGTGQHVLLERGDHLGSTGVVIDAGTGELVERSSFYGYGGTESDYRPERWKAFREDYRFTGKEEDVEVGLVYFGKRYLNPLLGRWGSADPLGVHAPGEADLNVYAYVSGGVVMRVDPVGLVDWWKAAVDGIQGVLPINVLKPAVEAINAA